MEVTLHGSTAPTQKTRALDMCSERDRMSVVASFGMDALQDDPELDRLARFVSQLCETEIALVSIVEEERQRFLVHEGLDAEETPRSWSFCAHAMTANEATIITDARAHPTFRDNPLVTGPPHIRFYAGAPLISPEGAPLGTLCAISSKPRPQGLTALQIEGLEVLADAVKRRLSAHRTRSEATAAARRNEERQKLILDRIPDIAWTCDASGEVTYFNQRWYEMTGWRGEELSNDLVFSRAFHPEDTDQMQAEWRHSVETGEPFESEVRVRRADGSYRWMLSRGVPLHDEDGSIAEWFGTLTDIDDSHRISEERELLAGELAHRIKNIFSVISGLVVLHAQGDASRKAFADLLSEHIRALARAQDFALQIGESREENLHDLLEVLLAPYGRTGEDAVEIAGDNLHTGVRAATPLALVFHEMATNSAKYGALGSAGGKVAIDIACDDETVAITWRESGGPPVEPPERTGFGSRLMRMSVEHQLAGKLERDWREDGLVITIRVPIERLQ